MDIAGLFSLAGRRALVTGASGVLGAHFARVLHGAGAAVALAARRSEAMAALATELGERVRKYRVEAREGGAWSTIGRGSRIGGTTTPMEMTYFSASSTVIFSSTTSARGTIRKKPDVGLGVVGT